MGGVFGVVSRHDCVSDLFFGVDYHSHLGTEYGGIAVWDPRGYDREIHSIRNTPFRSAFESDIGRMQGTRGIGVISDFEPQPLFQVTPLGRYGIVTVARINNLDRLLSRAFESRVHFASMSRGGVNSTDVISYLINQGASFEEGILNVQESVQGSCTLLLLTDRGLFAARDKLGRTPLVIGKKEDAYAVASETSAFHNTGFEVQYYLGPGEVIRITEEGWEQVAEPRQELQICAFLWVYYGFPASSYEGIGVEFVRNRCGAACACRDMAEGGIQIDSVAGIPDSGTGHGIGYAEAAGLPYKRPFVKYNATWSRSFMPEEQQVRDLIAEMKLIAVRELIQGLRLLFCEDSIVRGTQLQDTVQRLYDFGAKEVHMRPACPPLVYPCEFLNFSRTRTAFALAARKAIREIEGRDEVDLSAYVNETSPKHREMVERIRRTLRLTSLKYLSLEDMVAAIGLPKDSLCTHCWDASSHI
ncbi:MAG: amidophosphoribosyltransferase [Anaerolineae bacterium]|nr:amidophosphoribosyltransferase [Anaerolineae bacterium]